MECGEGVNLASLTLKRLFRLYSRACQLSVCLSAIFFSPISETKAQAFGGASWLYTDYNGFWSSGSTNFDETETPENSHHLLGFTWMGNTYSTGVDDGNLVGNNVTFSAQVYQAFPVRNIQAKPSGTYIGLGQLYDGVDNGISNPPPFPVPPNLASFLTMGLQGLDFGTGVANIAAGNLIFDFTGIIDPTQIGDGIPDVLVTQFADPSTTLDEIFMADADGNVVGNRLTINHTNIPRLGKWVADFYNIDGAGAAFIKGTRDLRLWGADLSAFGINQDNYHLVRSMRYRLNGTSDPAFAAYKVGVFDIVAANNDQESTNQETPVDIAILSNDLPIEILDLNTLRIITPPSNGQVTIDSNTGIVNYLPNKGFYGIDQFIYEICGSSELQCDEATVTIEVVHIPLPVDFLSISATQSATGEINIAWSTSKEKGNDYFEVQYSRDASKWKSAGRMEGQGYTTEKKNYQYTLPQLPEGNYFFRIKQVDFDNSFSFSEVIALKVKPVLKKTKIFPNPVNHILIVEGEEEELKEILITNTFGQSMESLVEIKEISPQKKEITVIALGKGIYVLRTGKSSQIFSKY